MVSPKFTTFAVGTTTLIADPDGVIAGAARRGRAVMALMISGVARCRQLGIQTPIFMEESTPSARPRCASGRTRARLIASRLWTARRRSGPGGGLQRRRTWRDRLRSRARDLGRPGEYPFTRGIYPLRSRGRLWTMRQYAGFSTAEETNRRFRYMLERGMSGINIASTSPPARLRLRPPAGPRGSRQGRGADQLAAGHGGALRRYPPRAGQPGQCHQCAGGGDPGHVRGPGREARVPLDRLSREHPERHPRGVHRARHLHLSPGAVAAPGHRHHRVLRRSAPRWNFINVCGYHMREGPGRRWPGGGLRAGRRHHLCAGGASTAACRWTGSRRASLFNFTAGTDLLREAAKFRAMRRLWARLMRERFGALKPASWAFGPARARGRSQLTAQQPTNNIVRVTLNALASILGGARSSPTPPPMTRHWPCPRRPRCSSRPDPAGAGA